jgi:hypothetical protein
LKMRQLPSTKENQKRDKDSGGGMIITSSRCDWM